MTTTIAPPQPRIFRRYTGDRRCHNPGVTTAERYVTLYRSGRQWSATPDAPGSAHIVCAGYPYGSNRWALRGIEGVGGGAGGGAGPARAVPLHRRGGLEEPCVAGGFGAGGIGAAHAHHTRAAEAGGGAAPRAIQAAWGRRYGGAHAGPPWPA